MLRARLAVLASRGLSVASARGVPAPRTPSGAKPPVSGIGAWRTVVDATAQTSGYHGCKSAAGYHAHLQAVFAQIDANEDGALSRDELRAALAASSVPTRHHLLAYPPR